MTGGFYRQALAGIHAALEMESDIALAACRHHKPDDLPIEYLSGFADGMRRALRLVERHLHHMPGTELEQRLREAAEFDFGEEW